MYNVLREVSGLGVLHPPVVEPHRSGHYITLTGESPAALGTCIAAECLRLCFEVTEAIDLPRSVAFEQL